MSSSDKSEAEPPLRVTHEVRSAATRAKLIEAAIHCLRAYGYSATSTTLVAETAGLSRGAMLHQFGAKVDLMLAVTRHVIDQQNQYFSEALRDYPRGRERFVGLTDVTWRVFSQPSNIALIEIMMGSRSDPALAERFPALAADVLRGQSDFTWRLAQQCGITDSATIDAMHLLHRAAMIGLSIQAMFDTGENRHEAALSLLHCYKGWLTDYLAGRAESEAIGAGKPARAPENQETK